MGTSRIQARAIAEMAENRHQYNRGVLAILGQEQLACDHESVSATVQMLVADRDALVPEADTLFDLLTLPEGVAQVQADIDQAVNRRRQAWAPIQSMIDEARAILAANDPLGMGQHA